MKPPSVVVALLAFLAASLHAAVSPISIAVEQNSKTKQPQAKAGKPAQGAKTHVRSLTVRLSNNSAESFGSLVVKYWFLGHDMKDHDIKVLKQGERKSALDPRGRDTVASEEVSSSYTEAHTEVAKGKGGSGKSKGGKSGVSMKKVAASGQKITGYAVQVVNGGTVEAEYYSEPSFKEKVKAAGPSLQPGPKAPAKKSPAKKKK